MRDHNLDRTALLVIDFQIGLDDLSSEPRNHPQCESHVRALIEAWRDASRPVVFVRHDAAVFGSPLLPGQPGNAFKPEVTGEPDLLVVKHTSSAFSGEPDLDSWLRERNLTGVAIVGAQTNYCCEGTARSAADLGYNVLFVLDATYTFGMPAYGGGTVTAEEVSRATATTLDGAYADVVRTEQLLAGL